MSLQADYTTVGELKCLLSQFPNDMPIAVPGDSRDGYSKIIARPELFLNIRDSQFGEHRIMKFVAIETHTTPETTRRR